MGDFDIGTGGVHAPPETLERARELVREYYGDKPAWFVGSRVTGDHRPDSDLDVVVESPCMNMKSDGCGRRFDERPVVIDVTEDPDGPVWRGPDAQHRIQ